MKRLAVLTAMVAVALALAAPVPAQEGVAATGAMERLDFTTYQYAPMP